MSLENNVERMAKALEELVEISRLQMALKVAERNDADKNMTVRVSPVEVVPPATATVAEPVNSAADTGKAKRGRPPKILSLNKTPEVIPPPTTPEPAPAPAPAPVPAAVTVEDRPKAETSDDDFLGDVPPPAEVVYPEPTAENVRKALVEYADRHGGSSPGAGGRQAARDLMLKVSGFQIMSMLEAKVAESGNKKLYADVIKAAMDG